MNTHLYLHSLDWDYRWTYSRALMYSVLRRWNCRSSTSAILLRRPRTYKRRSFFSLLLYLTFVLIFWFSAHSSNALNAISTPPWSTICLHVIAHSSVNNTNNPNYRTPSPLFFFFLPYSPVRFHSALSVNLSAKWLALSLVVANSFRCCFIVSTRNPMYRGSLRRSDSDAVNLGATIETMAIVIL